MRYYGLIDDIHLHGLIDEVCNCLGDAGGRANELLYETAGAETKYGKIKDPTLLAGMGLTQFDRIPFEDVKDRCRTSDEVKIQEYFGIDIYIVEWDHLRYNPLLALIFTRLKYIKVPEGIPGTKIGRAKYWKKYYNTEAGKGTPEHYLLMNS